MRNDWRIPVDWPAWVKVPPAKQQHKARIKDMSIFGLGIEMEFELESGSLVIVSMQTGTGFGKVKHCRKVADKKYFVGLYLDEFIPDEQSSREGQPVSLPGRFLHLVSKVVHSVVHLRWT